MILGVGIVVGDVFQVFVGLFVVVFGYYIYVDGGQVVFDLVLGNRGIVNY